VIEVPGIILVLISAFGECSSRFFRLSGSGGIMATVVIADDSAFMVSTIKAILESVTHQIVGTAKCGEEAITLCQQHNPDLVMMDILMPGMGGLSALDTIKKAKPEIKVIMVTAFGQESKIQEATAKGASGYIRKPFKKEEIISTVNKVLAN
jgi:two-component system chemotaxis response regulator CheY